MLWLGEVFRPARAGAVEDDFHDVTGLEAFMRNRQAVEEAAERFLASVGIGHDYDG
jgi:hypothetical protein